MIQELSKPDLIPSMPAPAAPGTPLDLLKRRPDIQQAERELAAATARIGVATANLFPQVALVASIGSQGQGWGTTPSVSKHIWSFGPGAVWPLLDFGALDAEVDIADLAAHASMVNYRKTILNAVQQVDTSLDAYEAQQDRMENLSTAMIAGERALYLATSRYNRGLTDFLNVVDAERQLYDLEEQYADAQVAQGEQFVQLYKSFGGGWQNYQDVPGHPAPAAGDHCRVSPRAEQLIAAVINLRLRAHLPAFCTPIEFTTFFTCGACSAISPACSRIRSVSTTP